MFAFSCSGLLAPNNNDEMPGLRHSPDKCNLREWTASCFRDRLKRIHRVPVLVGKLTGRAAAS